MNTKQSTVPAARYILDQRTKMNTTTGARSGKNGKSSSKVVVTKFS